MTQIQAIVETLKQLGGVATLTQINNHIIDVGTLTGHDMKEVIVELDGILLITNGIVAWTRTAF